MRLLEIIRHYKKKKIKFYQASSSEMFGKTKPPQNENTLYFNQDLFMQFQKFLHTIVLYITEMLMHYMRVMAYFLIMNHLEGVLIL